MADVDLRVQRRRLGVLPDVPRQPGLRAGQLQRLHELRPLLLVSFAPAGQLVAMIWPACAGLVMATALSTVGLILRRRFVSVSVDGQSMEPFLRSGQHVLVRRTTIDRVRRGQVAVLAYRSQDTRGWIIKRVVALPGDPVPEGSLPVRPSPPGVLVPAGRLVLLGDNRAISQDSRLVGYYRAEDLLGVVVRPLRR